MTREQAMTQARRSMGRQSIAPRPEVPVVDYHHEISDANFEKIRAAVAELNDPARRRHLVSSVEGCDVAAFITALQSAGVLSLEE